MEKNKLVALLNLTSNEIIKAWETGEAERLDDGFNPMQQLFTILEHIFLFSLKGDDKDLYTLLERVQDFCPDAAEIAIKVNEGRVTTEMGKTRAWLRLAMMQKKLADYVNVLMEKKEVLREFYEEGAILLEEDSSTLYNIIDQLNCLDIHFSIDDSAALDAPIGSIDYSLYLSGASLPGPDIDHTESDTAALHSTEAITASETGGSTESIEPVPSPAVTVAKPAGDEQLVSGPTEPTVASGSAIFASDGDSINETASNSKVTASDVSSVVGKAKHISCRANSDSFTQTETPASTDVYSQTDIPSTKSSFVQTEKPATKDASTQTKTIPTEDKETQTERLTAADDRLDSNRSMELLTQAHAVTSLNESGSTGNLSEGSERESFHTCSSSEDDDFSYSTCLMVPIPSLEMEEESELEDEVVVDIAGYVAREWKGTTSKAQQIRQGYASVMEEHNFKHLVRIRGDNYCALRATFASIVLSNIPLDLPFEKTLQRLISVNEADPSLLQLWVFPECSPNITPNNSFTELREILTYMIGETCRLVGIKHSTNRRRELCKILNTGGTEELYILEGMKLLMLLSAHELHKKYTSGQEVPVFAWLFFARDTSETPALFLKKHLNSVGRDSGLEQVEVCLLGYSLGVTLQTFRLYQHGEADFVALYPEDDSFKALVPIIAEDDRHYNTLLRVDN